MISDRKASGGFEHKIAGLKKATFVSSRCFCCCCYCTVPPQKNTGKIAGFFVHLPCEQRFLSCMAFSVSEVIRVACLSHSWFIHVP